MSHRHPRPRGHGPPWTRGSQHDDHWMRGPGSFRSCRQRQPWARDWDTRLHKLRPLHRRIFRWFGASILLSALATFAAFSLVSPLREPHHHSPLHRAPFVVALGTLGLTLWAASWILARRLTWPLRDLVRVTRELGRGDLTARAQIRRQHLDEVSELALSVNEMAERIEDQLREQRELLAAVSHEVRTPLGHVRLLLELGKEGSTSRDVLGEIEREVTEIDRLVGKLLASSRLDFGVLEARDLPLVPLVERALERAGEQATLLDNHAPAVVVRGDATLLAQALGNLLDNAQRHGGGVSRIVVELTDKSALVHVEDRGPGFDEEALDRAFQPFQGGTREGLGLGLTLVQRIATAHGGTARAANVPSGGARVSLELPISRTNDTDHGVS